MKLRLLWKAFILATVQLSNACVVVNNAELGVDPDSTDNQKPEDPNRSPYGAWTFEAAEDIVPGQSELFILYPNGQYFQWSPTEEPEERPNAELGTVQYLDGVLSQFQHVQNGAGGFDDDGGESPYSSSLTVDITETTMFMREPQLTWNRVTSATNPLVGAWDFDDQGYNHVLVFFAQGNYFQWCNDVACDAEVTGNQEVGNYLLEDGVLTIADVTTDGPGGFETGVTAVTTFSPDARDLTLAFFEDDATEPTESVTFRRLQ
jgi:hypothetical protein